MDDNMDINKDLKLSLIVACTNKGGIGYDNTIPWHLKDELKNFRELTSRTSDKYKRNVIIMGKKTWDSLNVKPLPNRINIILTSNKYLINNYNYNEDFVFLNSIDNALKYCKKNKDKIEDIFIIGGEKIYEAFLKDSKYIINNVYLTLLKKEYECNKFIDVKYILRNFEFNIENVIFTSDYIMLAGYNQHNPQIP